MGHLFIAREHCHHALVDLCACFAQTPHFSSPVCAARARPKRTATATDRRKNEREKKRNTSEQERRERDRWALDMWLFATQLSVKLTTGLPSLLIYYQFYVNNSISALSAEHLHLFDERMKGKLSANSFFWNEIGCRVLFSLLFLSENLLVMRRHDVGIYVSNITNKFSQISVK